MLTVDSLKAYGADTDEGMARCMNNEAFYLKMVGMGIADERFETLKGVLESGDYEQAFEMAHALKGVLGNLALTPIYTPMEEMTELLRAKDTQADYMAYYSQIKTELDRLLELIG